jgi:hypothetical protein
VSTDSCDLGYLNFITPNIWHVQYCQTKKIVSRKGVWQCLLSKNKPKKHHFCVGLKLSDSEIVPSTFWIVETWSNIHLFESAWGNLHLSPHMVSFLLFETYRKECQKIGWAPQMPMFQVLVFETWLYAR